MKQAGAYLIGGSVAVLFHLVVGGSLASVDPRRWNTPTRTNVELEVLEPPPPPPEKPPEPPPPEPKPPERPKLAMRRISPKPVLDTPKPPPSEPPPEPPKETAPPVFGVTLDSTVTGDANMAVPVGQTVATNDRTPHPPAPPAPSEGPPAFAPVPDSYVSQIPQVVQHDPREELDRQGAPGGLYPRDALRLGIEGVVVLRVGIDKLGKVRSVRVIKKAGYGFDEAATQALWRYKWSPALTNDGRAVDFLVTYKYSFRPPQ